MMLKLIKMTPSSPSTGAIHQHALAAGSRNLPLISLVQAPTSRIISSQVWLVDILRHLVFKEAHSCLIVALERMMMVLGDHADGRLVVDGRCHESRVINSSSDRGATYVYVAAHTAHVHALIQAVLLRVGLLRLQAHLVIKTAT